MGVSNTLRIGEIAREAGVSPDTIRHYERVGVLPHPPRTLAGYRRFSGETIERVRLVRRALAIGFSLAELARILKVRDAGGVPCKSVHALAKQKLQSLKVQIADLIRLRTQMENVLRSWDHKMALAPKGKRAGLLDSLKGSPPKLAFGRKHK
jgi:MerR family transcriptional regulator, copper efflux regulator